MNEKSLQLTYAPDSICFGCGPTNDRGLRINSFVDGDYVVAEWSALKHHEAFPGVLNGGIIGTLLDCVEGELSSGGKVCATCRGTFVAVKEGHPAYFRW